MKKEDIKFKIRIVSNLYNSDSFKIYTGNVDNNIYKNLKSNKYGTYTIVGNLPNLVPNIDYEVIAIETINKKYGVNYSVKSIKRDKPTDYNSSLNFLQEILTQKQAETLLEAYPNIIDKVVKNDLDDLDLSKTKGIKEATFAKIKDKIIENFCLIELVDTFGGLIDIGVIKKLYDKYHNVKTIKEELKKDPYTCLCKLSRVGFKTADSILLNLEEQSKLNPNKFKFDYDLKVSVQRMKSCLNYILEENETNGNTTITIKEARERCGKLVPQCIHMFVDVIKNHKEDIYVDMNRKIMSSKVSYDTELFISDFVKHTNNNPIKWNIKAELYREVDGFTMTDEQLKTIELLNDNNLVLLTASAGSGKSASVMATIKALEDNNKSYVLMTPTGASSKVLKDYTKRPCGTIHRQLEYNPANEDNKWEYNQYNKLECDIVIIDEFSMVDIFLFRNVINAIDITKTKVLLVFDPYQLASVSCGNIAHDLIQSEVVKVNYLSKIFRYNEGGLMQVATKIRNSEKFIDKEPTKPVILGDNKDFIYFNVDKDNIVKQVVATYSKLLKDGYSPNDIMVLSSQNKGDYGTKEINKYIQRLIQKDKKNNFVIRGDNKFYKEDKVIQVVNNYRINNIKEEECSVFNGNTGIVNKVKYDELDIEYDEDILQYKKEDLTQIELGYCITNHKSQGSSAKQIIVIAPSSHTFMLNSNLLYVGVTRAKERVFMFGNYKTINSAIRKKENFSRNTWLQELLHEDNIINRIEEFKVKYNNEE